MASTLAIPNGSHSLRHLPILPVDVWVDASTSVGIDILVDSHWAAWLLVNWWDSEGQNIGWVEAVAIELAVMWLTHSGFHNACLKIKCNNTSVISSFWKGHSRNPARNDCILRPSSSLATANLTIKPSYVQSTLNKADDLSRGILGTHDSRLCP